MIEGSSGWIVAVNLVIWTGLFGYVLFLDRKVRRLQAGTHQDSTANHTGESDR